MKVYCVVGYYEDEGLIRSESKTYFYGVFSTKEKAEKILATLEEDASQYDDTCEEFKIEEFELDKPTEWYDWVMSYT